MITENISKILFTIFGILFGTIVTRIVNRNREKVNLAFDMHKEYGTLEMSNHRKNAAEFIQKYPKTTFDKINEKDKELSISLLMVMRFYQRLWLAIKHNQIKKNLIPELFGEAFYYWYFLSFGPNLTTIYWDSSSQIKELLLWMSKKDKSEKHQKDIEKFKTRYKNWTKKKTKPNNV